MPLLAADIGNSHTVLGLIGDGEVVADWRVATDARRTADEWAVLLRGLLGDEVEISGIAVCATVPAVLHEWRDMLVRHFPDVPHVVVEPGVRTGVPILMDNPREVGTDRIINALAAARTYSGPGDRGRLRRHRHDIRRGERPGPVRRRGDHARASRSRSRRSAGVAPSCARSSWQRPRSVIAKNTVEALQSGMVFGVASQVEGIVERMTAELGAVRRRGAGDRHRLPRPAGARRVPVLHRPRPVADVARPGAGLRNGTPDTYPLSN